MSKLRFKIRCQEQIKIHGARLAKLNAWPYNKNDKPIVEGKQHAIRVIRSYGRILKRLERDGV